MTYKQNHVDKLNEQIEEFILTENKKLYAVDNVILTYNGKYNADLDNLFSKCETVAKLAVKYHYNSSKQVKCHRIPSAISNAVMRKYGRSHTIKNVSNVVIPVDKQSIRWDGHVVTIVPLKIQIEFEAKYHPDVLNIQHIELSKDGIAHIQCQVRTELLYDFDSYMGIDRNSTSFVCVAANEDTGKVWKLGKDVSHTHRKYSSLRRKIVKCGQTKKHHKFRQAHKLSHRERNKNKHSLLGISRKVVLQAKEDNAVLVLEDLVGIRKQARRPCKQSVKDKSNAVYDNLNSWSQYKLGTFISYIAHLLGVPIIYINPAYTSQRCSHCGRIVGRDRKEFKCTYCGHVDHADVNAAFNIAHGGRSYVDSVTYDGEN